MHLNAAHPDISEHPTSCPRCLTAGLPEGIPAPVHRHSSLHGAPSRANVRSGDQRRMRRYFARIANRVGRMRDASLTHFVTGPNVASL